MELTLNPGELGVCVCRQEETARQSLDEDYTLPDYCAPIRRILKCVLQPNISGVSRTGDRVSAGGEIGIRLIYVNEDDRIDCCEQTCTLSVSAQMRDLSAQAVVTAAAAVEYVNCRATGQRKFSVSAAVSVRFCALERSGVQLASQPEGRKIEAKTQTLSCLNLVSVSEKRFDLSETVALQTEQPSIGSLLQADAVVKITSRKAVSEKLLLQGVCEVHIVYRADTRDGEITRLVHTLPVSQVLDVPGATEDGVCDTRISVCALQTMVRADGAGENRLLELAVKVAALTKAYEKIEQPVILDCYATDGAILPSYETRAFLSAGDFLELRTAVRETLDLGGIKAAAVHDVYLLKTETAVRAAEDGPAAELQLLFRLLLTDSEGQLQYAERSVTVSVPLRTQTDSAIELTPAVVAEQLTASVTDGAVQVSFDCLLRGQIYLLHNVRVCVKIEADDTTVPNEKSALTLCFAQKGQTLWEIAKQYQTTCDLIRAENDLQEDPLAADRMLLVPSA